MNKLGQKERMNDENRNFSFYFSSIAQIVSKSYQHFNQEKTNQIIELLGLK
jgi:type IV secretory pathway VirB6-like protein